MKATVLSRFLLIISILTSSTYGMADGNIPFAKNVENYGNPVLNLSETVDPKTSLRSNGILDEEGEKDVEMNQDEASPPSPTEEQNSTGSPFSSQSPSPSTSTSPPPPTTTTDKPFTIPGEGEATRGYFCLCDLHMRECDMNCCCDVDCTEEDKQLFTGCDGSVIYDPKNHQNKEHSCVKSYVMYRENIPYRVDRPDKSLFCIVRENVKQEREFSQKDIKRIKKRISHGKIDSKPKYGWDQLHFAKGFKISPQPYKYGSPIWTRKLIDGKNEEAMLSLPAPFHNELCSIREPVKFLVSSISSCTLPVVPLDLHCESLRALDANQFIRNYLIVVNPAKMDVNSTDYPLPNEMMSAKVCQNDWNNCKEVAAESLTSGDDGDESSNEDEGFEIPKPVKKLSCLNVLSHLNLTFIHEGVEGITHIVAKVLLVEVPLNEKQIQQHYSVDFIWGGERKLRNDTNQTDSIEDILALQKLPRSGNPGYIVGKPIILGEKVIGKILPANDTASASQNSLEKIHVLPNSSQWLHIHGAGDCPVDSDQIKSFSKYPVIFGYEHVSNCKLPLESFLSCKKLQNHIASIIFGIVDGNPQTFIKSPLYVAAYGSPDAFPSDWVPLTFVEMSSFLSGSPNSLSQGCNSIFTSVHITIAHAYVGPVDQPQAKIAGVFYEPEDPIQIPALDYEKKGEEKKAQDLTVTTTVSFVDVSGKPTSRVATWPVLSVQLPADFFYPFSSSVATQPSSGIERIPKREFFRNFGFTLIMFIGVYVVA